MKAENITTGHHRFIRITGIPDVHCPEMVIEISYKKGIYPATTSMPVALDNTIIPFLIKALNKKKRKARNKISNIKTILMEMFPDYATTQKIAAIKHLRTMGASAQIVSKYLLHRFPQYRAHGLTYDNATTLSLVGAKLFVDNM